MASLTVAGHGLQPSCGRSVLWQECAEDGESAIHLTSCEVLLLWGQQSVPVLCLHVVTLLLCLHVVTLLLCLHVVTLLLCLHALKR